MTDAGPETTIGKVEFCALDKPKRKKYPSDFKKRVRPKRSGEYESWAGMLDRCRNPKNKRYARYGGRGIRVCERWHSSANFIADMGPRQPGTTLDRIDNDGHYEPGNCRWATRKQQQRNRSVNHIIHHAGESLTVSEWAERAGLSVGVFATRLKRGWPIERALAPRRPRSGERSVAAKLSLEQVLLIKASTASHAQLGRELGVSPGAILDIRKGRTWKANARA